MAFLHSPNPIFCVTYLSFRTCFFLPQLMNRSTAPTGVFERSLLIRCAAITAWSCMNSFCMSYILRINTLWTQALTTEVWFELFWPCLCWTEMSLRSASYKPCSGFTFTFRFHNDNKYWEEMKSVLIIENLIVSLSYLSLAFSMETEFLSVWHALLQFRSNVTTLGCPKAGFESQVQIKVYCQRWINHIMLLVFIRRDCKCDNLGVKI